MKIDSCEAWLDNNWQVEMIDDVLAMDPRPLLRCADCHGRVRAHHQANNGMRAHFEHFEKHEGCSLKSTFKGSRSRHPNPMS